MRKLLFSFTLCVSCIFVFGQSDPKTAVHKLGPNPMVFIDSQRVKLSDVAKYNADSVTSFTMLYDTAATQLYGDSARDGIVFVESRGFAKRRLISFFRKFSHSFDSLYSITGTDSSFVYIINNKVQTGNYEGNLADITGKLFLGIDILTKEQLDTQFKIQDKQFGILVHSNRTKDLNNADKKF